MQCIDMTDKFQFVSANNIAYDESHEDKSSFRLKLPLSVNTKVIQSCVAVYACTYGNAGSPDNHADLRDIVGGANHKMLYTSLAQ